MFHPTKLPHTLAWGSWSLGLAGTGAYCSTYYMVQAMEYYQVLVLPTIYYYIYGPAPTMEYYQVLVFRAANRAKPSDFGPFFGLTG